MRRSPSHLDQPIPLSKIRAYYHAWYAVRDGIPLDEFLLWRLRLYQARYRRSHFPLPRAIVIADGEVKEIANASFEDFWQAQNDSTSEDLGVPILTPLETVEIARQLENIEAELARLTLRILHASDQVEALDDEKDDAIRSGAVLGPITEKCSGGRRRPRLPFPWVPVLGYTAIVSMIGFEAYQLAPPFYDGISVDSTNLSREWLRNPLGVVSGAGFALSASFGLSLLWYLALRSASSFAKTWDSAGPVRTALRAGGLFTQGCILLAGTYFLANMRHGLLNAYQLYEAIQQGQLSGAAIGQSVFFFLTLLVPFAAAYIHHRIGQSAYWGGRRDAIQKVVEWDRQTEERVLTDEQLAARRHRRQQEREGLEGQRALLQNQRQALDQRVQGAQRTHLERLDQAQRSTEVYARSLLAALQQDRVFYIRIANRHKPEPPLPPQVGRPANHLSQPPLPVLHALLPVGRNGHVD